MVLARSANDDGANGLSSCETTPRPCWLISCTTRSSFPLRMREPRRQERLQAERGNGEVRVTARGNEGPRSHLRLRRQDHLTAGGSVGPLRSGEPKEPAKRARIVDATRPGHAARSLAADRGLALRAGPADPPSPAANACMLLLLSQTVFPQDGWRNGFAAR